MLLLRWRLYMRLKNQLTLTIAMLISSAFAFGQTTPNSYIAPNTLSPIVLNEAFKIAYAANLNIGDAVVNITNDGAQGGFALFGGTPAGNTEGNICVNTYVFDPQEEEIGCCACLVTPNGLNSLSAKADLISNNLTPAVPTSIVIKLIASQPALSAAATAAGGTGTATFTVCNPARIDPTGPVANNPYAITPSLALPAAGAPLASGLHAWVTTLEPAGTPGTYAPVGFKFDTGHLSSLELTQLNSVCNFIQANGTGFGICKSCRLGALGGAKQ
jgi:hypothetical protein